MKLFQLGLSGYELSQNFSSILIIPPRFVIAEVQILDTCDVGRVERLEQLISFFTASESTKPELLNVWTIGHNEGGHVYESLANLFSCPIHISDGQHLQIVRLVRQLF